MVEIFEWRENSWGELMSTHTERSGEMESSNVGGTKEKNPRRVWEKGWESLH